MSRLKYRKISLSTACVLQLVHDPPSVQATYNVTPVHSFLLYSYYSYLLLLTVPSRATQSGVIAQLVVHNIRKDSKCIILTTEYISLPVHRLSAVEI